VPRVDQIDFEQVPDSPGVYVLWPLQGAPHIGKTTRLRRRLSRLLRLLGPAAERVDYYPTGSAFESMLAVYRLARRHRPEDYRVFLRLRIPPFLKLDLANPYPRCHLTRRLGSDSALYFGPFTTRAAAERFQSAFLDLFLIRRCREEIRPDPAHPGCIYGEMSMCLRPCQGASTPEQYHAEAGRVAAFLTTAGRSLVRQLGEDRQQASAELEFERAARLHRRLEKTLEALKLNEELARDLDRFYGVVIQRSVDPQSVELWFFKQGFLQPGRRLGLAVQEGRPESLDQKLRQTIENLGIRRQPARRRAEQLGLLLRWHASSWRQGEWLMFDDPDQVPYRKLVRAVSRVGQDPAREFLIGRRIPFRGISSSP